MMRDLKQNRSKKSALWFAIGGLLAAVMIFISVWWSTSNQVIDAESPDIPTADSVVQADSIPEVVRPHRIDESPAPVATPPDDGDPAEEQTESVPDPVSDVLQELRQRVLRGPYGEMPIEDVLAAFRNTPGGSEVQEILRVLVVRKAEALPDVKERLITGEWYERYLMTKLLRYSPWPETFNDLLQLAKNNDAEHYLGRQGAIMALAAMGNPNAGPTLTDILRDPFEESDVHMIAIAALAMIGYREATNDIRSFAESNDLQMRLFANRSLAELGQPIDREFLLQALMNDHYTIRESACYTLALVIDDYIHDRLLQVAEDDPNQAVRAAARLALLRIDTIERQESEALQVLANALHEADRYSEAELIHLILKQCGEEGRQFIASLSQRDDSLGERAGTLLLWHTAAEMESATMEVKR
jgi:hypothetical protein